MEEGRIEFAWSLEFSRCSQRQPMAYISVVSSGNLYSRISMVQGVRGIGKRTIREGHHNLELSSFPIRLNESQRLSQTSKEEERHMLLADL